MATITKQKLLQGGVLGQTMDYVEYELTAQISSAEILGLSGAQNPIELLPAVTGRVYIPLAAIWRFTFNTIQYVFGDGSDCHFIICAGGNSGNTFLAPVLANNLLADVDKILLNSTPDEANVLAQSLDNVAGESLTVACADALPLITDGNGTLEVTIAYRVVDV